MDWKKHFDAIYLINLDKRTDRLAYATEELGKYGIPFERYRAIEHYKGELGIYLTLYSLIEKAYFEGKEQIIVFEDDVKFISDPNEWFDKMIDYFPNNTVSYYDFLYLGCNTHEPLEKSLYPSLRVVKNAYATHAVIYSRRGMFKLLKAFNKNADYYIRRSLAGPDIMTKVIWYTRPSDVIMAEQIQVDGQCFCTYPMLANQRDDFSDIEHKTVSRKFLEERFIENTK